MGNKLTDAQRAATECPDCVSDPHDQMLHTSGCRRVDMGAEIQCGPPWSDWPEDALMGGELTPYAELVYDGEPLTDAWFEARRQGITGTDLPKLLGISKYGNALSVWRDKRGEGSADPGNIEAAHWGHILEDPVAQEWAKSHSTTVQPVGIIAKTAAPWMRASLDRIVDACPDQVDLWQQCGLEVKTRSAYVAGKWREEIPDDVLAQVQWGLMVTGFDHMHVAVLIGGQKMSSYRVDRDPTLEGYLLTAGAKAWASVVDDVPPQVDADADGVLIAELNAMFSAREGEVELPPEAADHLDAYEAAGDIIKDQAAQQAVAKSKLIQMLGSGQAGTLDGAVCFTYKRPKPGHTLAAADLKRLKRDDPATFDELLTDGYITPTEPGPRFNLK